MVVFFNYEYGKLIRIIIIIPISLEQTPPGRLALLVLSGKGGGRRFL